LKKNSRSGFNWRETFVQVSGRILKKTLHNLQENLPSFWALSNWLSVWSWQYPSLWRKKFWWLNYRCFNTLLANPE